MYLYSDTAPMHIHNFNPEAKLICILRSPLEVMWSLYRYNVVNLEEDLIPFEKALQAEDDRKAGRCIPRSTTILQNLFYRDIVDFAPQIERYQKLFSPERLLVLLIDDFKRDSDGVYQEILSFLGLPPFHLESFEAKNRNDNKAIVPLRQFLWNHRRFRKFVDARIPASVKEPAKRALRRMLGQPAWTKFDPSLRNKLHGELAPKVRTLGEVLGRDLNQWIDAKQ